MDRGERDTGRLFAEAGGAIAEIAGLPRAHLVLADDGRALLLVPAGEPPDERERRIRAALARLGAGDAVGR